MYIDDKVQLDSVVRQVRRTISQELIEMAKFQPPRFNDFVQNLKFIKNTPIHINAMSNEVYETWRMANVFLDVLETIPLNKLTPKERKND
jgi:hypothetical protein